MFVQLQYGNEVGLLYSTLTGSLFNRLWVRFSLLFGGNLALYLETTVACYRYATPFLFNVATVVLFPY